MKTDNKILSIIYLALVFIGAYLVGGTIARSFKSGEITLHSLEFKDLIIALVFSALYHWWKARKEKAKNEQL